MLKTKSFCLSVVSGDVAAAGDADDEHHPGDVGGEVQLTGLGVDVAGQDIVQHHILDKVGLVELLVVILLDALEADGQQRGELARSLVSAFHEDGIIVMLCAGELLIGVAIPHEAVSGRQTLCHKALAHLADQIQLRAGDDSAGLIHHADHTVDRVLHLVDHALKYSIGHKWIPLFLSCANRRWAGL